MRLPACPRCGGYMQPERGSETWCLMCGHHDYGVPIYYPSAKEIRIDNKIRYQGDAQRLRL